ncbi:hypothetical protein [Mycolicibacterium litorale]|uniref:Low molecular weight antigen MTB12-like C-terminal domain-containing protein n=1 Tax=Mycolicibacterium litorale TaxID=758802 RepID=A0AAD1MTS8_9MYCO|nr:hypothetical protein [Mycolicibacterium litorale]MCV7414271.1 hypothetical protein [Mycolicibacterium litorale]TDY02037.1 hypothetical protein BCL50_4647 [Mycolicibacterium litorale]BBY15537.1 hypothetical protein MLIT_11290 [Mycolicibacterium litorale]
MTAVVRSAVTILVAAFGLCGCGSDKPPAPAPTAATSAPAAPAVAPPPAPLPPPSALTDVLYRLADPNVPGAQRAGLIEDAGPGDAAALDRFGRALADNGYHPMTFDAADLAWTATGDADGDDVVATVIARTPPGRTGGDFTFPMEFAHTPDGGWLLTRDSADMLLEVDAAQNPPR